MFLKVPKVYLSRVEQPWGNVRLLNRSDLKTTLAGWESSQTIFRAFWWSRTLITEERDRREWPEGSPNCFLWCICFSKLWQRKSPPASGRNLLHLFYRLLLVFILRPSESSSENNRSPKSPRCSVLSICVVGKPQTDVTAAECWCSNLGINKMRLVTTPSGESIIVSVKFCRRAAAKWRTQEMNDLQIYVQFCRAVGDITVIIILWWDDLSSGTVFILHMYCRYS